MSLPKWNISMTTLCIKHMQVYSIQLYKHPKKMTQTKNKYSPQVDQVILNMLVLNLRMQLVMISNSYGLYHSLIIAKQNKQQLDKEQHFYLQNHQKNKSTSINISLLIVVQKKAFYISILRITNLSLYHLANLNKLKANYHLYAMLLNIQLKIWNPSLSQICNSLSSTYKKIRHSTMESNARFKKKKLKELDTTLNLG